MENGRVRLWSSDKRQAYMESVQRSHERALAERDGQPVATNIAQAWNRLQPDARELIRCLVTLDAQTLVGQCEEALLKRMVEDGFLQLPIGVRLVLLQDLETVFSVPEAVWRELKSNRDNLLEVQEHDLERAKNEIAVRFERRIKPIVPGGG